MAEPYMMMDDGPAKKVLELTILGCIDTTSYWQARCLKAMEKWFRAKSVLHTVTYLVDRPTSNASIIDLVKIRNAYIFGRRDTDLRIKGETALSPLISLPFPQARAINTITRRDR